MINPCPALKGYIWHLLRKHYLCHLAQENFPLILPAIVIVSVIRSGSTNSVILVGNTTYLFLPWSGVSLIMPGSALSLILAWIRDIFCPFVWELHYHHPHWEHLLCHPSGGDKSIILPVCVVPLILLGGQSPSSCFTACSLSPCLGA